MNLRALAVCFVLAPTVTAQTNPIAIVSAASYRNVIAPDSLASIFGSGLARTTASATLDANGQLPIELASTRVEVNGLTAALIYVSPGQINFVVPSGIASGATIVTVRSTDTGATRTAAVQIAATAPALFSSDASGTGPGAFLNAVTFRPAPFFTVTAENGSDTQTRLAAYGTGFRAAKNVAATAIDSTGNRFDLTVEFAGAAPGFFGLDQLNFVVPADLDGAGAVSFTVTTEDAISNTVTFQMNLLPLNLLQLAGIALSPNVVNAGDSMTAAILLNGVARFGGFPVALRTTNLAAQVTQFVTIPEGQASFNITVSTTAVNTVQIGAISAQAGGVTVSANFEIDPPFQAQLGGISVTPATTLGGRALQAIVSLTVGAPAGGVNVRIASDNAAVRPPAMVTIPFHATSVSFSIPTVAVNGPQDVIIAAALNRTTVSSKVQVLPVLTLSLDMTVVTGGSIATGTITLADPAPPGGATIALTSSDGVAARVPPFFTIAAGQNSGGFNVTTTPAVGARTVKISATYLGLTQSVVLTVNPQPAPALSTLVVSPDHIPGGQSTQGAVTLTAAAPAGGMVVMLQSSLLGIAQAPAFVTLTQGQSSASFTITTSPVPVPETVVITATANGITKTAILTVQ